MDNFQEAYEFDPKIIKTQTTETGKCYRLFALLTFVVNFAGQ